MRRLIIFTFIFGIGLAIGWQLHGIRDSAAAAASASLSSAATDLPTATTADQLPHRSTAAPPDSSRTEQKLFSSEEFLHLLNTRFEAAIEAYSHNLGQNPAAAASLRPVFESWLRQCMSYCTTGDFYRKVDSWLHVYYEDIQVLLLLAEHQSAQGYPEEAAMTLQYASTYAYQESQRSAVTRALDALVVTTDQRLVASTRWVELTGFYELLDSIGLTQPEYQLRQALLYQQLGELSSARALLLTLAAADQYGDEAWRERVQAAIGASTPSEPAAVAALTETNAVPLQRLGEHYVLEVNINNTALTLLLDTGASMTTLSRAGFAKLESSKLQYLGRRLFNTAGGVTSGEVYQTRAITLGNNTWQQLDIAVLNYPTAAGVDGLLGMNLLRNYRFQIDQDQLLLYLQPR
jgi:clan AA aspartic protease (TIGR02281 family)